MAKQPAKSRKTPTKPKAKPETAVTETSGAVQVEAAATEVPVVEQPIQEAEPTVDTPEPQAPEVVQDSAKPPVTESKSPGAAILGGLVAGAIGFGAAYIVLPKPDTTLPAQVRSQALALNDLRDQISALPVTDLSELTQITDQTADQVGTVSERITTLETRLDDLSSRASETGSVSVAAYEAELDALRAEMESFRGAAIAELEAARDQAASIEANAEAAARAAAGRAALARVQGGLETGAPLGEALDDLADAVQGELPDALASLRDGVPTLASLQVEFPPLARDALATARAEGVSGETEGGFASFFRDQFDVRSVAPKEGNSTDAILSRAEASLRLGRLTDTLAEINALPEVARTPLSDWIGLAEARADALSAAATLSTSLNDN